MCVWGGGGGQINLLVVTRGGYCIYILEGGGSSKIWIMDRNFSWPPDTS